MIWMIWLIVFLIVINLYFMKRNSDVYYFIMYVKELENKQHSIEINNYIYRDKYFELTNSLNYNKMLYSFKPLKLETYFNESEIKYLLGEQIK